MKHTDPKLLNCGVSFTFSSVTSFAFFPTVEQYYNSNVQRSRLVQRDIRVAKRLQDEEEQRAQMLQQQATRQL